MTSKEIKLFYTSGKIDQLYKNTKPIFDKIDNWAEKMCNGDLMDENDINYAMQQLVGSYAKLNSIASALEALVIEYENNYIIIEDNKFDKLNVPNQTHAKAIARKETSDLRNYASDFSSYCASANSMIVTCQSRLKRLTVEKTSKGIAFTGEVVNAVEAEERNQKKWNE